MRGKILGTFEATFDKPLSTGDGLQDYILTPGSMVDIIWAQGLAIGPDLGIHEIKGTSKIRTSQGIIKLCLNMMIVLSAIIFIFIY